MKKLFLILFILFFLIGCRKKEEPTIENIDSSLLTSSNLLTKPIDVSGSRYSVTTSVNDELYGSAKVVYQNTNYGTIATVRAIEKYSTFMFWVENGRIISKEKEYSFSVSERHNLIAYFVPNNKHASIFIDQNNDLIDFIVNDVKTDQTSKLPFKKAGFEFIKYQVKEDTSKFTYFIATYENINSKCKINITDGFIKGTNLVASEVLYGSTITLYSDKDDFSYWKINNQVVSYNKEFTMTIYKDMVIEAVRNEGKINKMIVVNHDFILDNNQIMFVGQYENPNKLKIVEVGVMFIYGEEYLNVPIQGWDAINKQRINNISINNEFALYANLEKGQAVSICTYVKTNNGTDNNPIYVDHYSNIISYHNN